MNPVKAFLALILGLTAVSAQSPLSVSDVRASQRAGTKLVDVYYDISGGTPPYSVTFEGSSDGGATWTLPVTSVSGDVGSGVTAGTNRKVTWDAGADWAGEASEQVRFRVTANDTGAAPEGFELIPAGPFTMGRTSGDADGNAPPVTVTVSEFYMGKYEVTKALWDEVRAWGLSNGYTDLPTGGGKGADHPVHTIAWYAMVKWCNARSEKEGLTPCYTVGGATYKTGISTSACNWSVSGYRLPTEAEWEKAARGGLSGKRFPWGDTIDHSHANYSAYGSAFAYDTSPYTSSTYHPDWDDDGFPHTSSVGSFAPNGYGLYDVAGNVWEWCYDRYGSGYYTNGAVNPTGPASGTDRVLRGGSWLSVAINCRPAYRVSNLPANTDSIVGFRLARSVVP